MLASRIDGEVSHYRDSNSNEIDAIITLPDGHWGAVEVKLSGQQLSAGTASLRVAIEQVDTTAVGIRRFASSSPGTGDRADSYHRR